MLNEPAKQWVAELRSGKYKQGKAKLRSTSNEYCCLGVACDMAVNAGIIEESKTTVCGFIVYGSRRSGMYCAASLPEEVKKWLGLSSDNGEFEGNSLANLNDTGTTFDEIADVIESEPPGLFKE